MKSKVYLSLLVTLGVATHGAGIANAQSAIAEDAAPDQQVVAVRRLGEDQYRQSIRDIFGDEIEISARFEPGLREHGLLALGSATLSLTASGFEQYFNLSRDVSRQVLSPQRRASVLHCAPDTMDTFDSGCAAEFLSEYGELLFRRPLTSDELQSRLETAAEGMQQTGDFYQGMELALGSLLVAPDFLFRIERAEPDPANAGELRLDAYTKAARLSFLFWNSTPDAELLAAAASQELHTQQGLEEQLLRLADSPRLRDGVRAFLVDMMQIDGFENMVKDPAIYPKFNQLVADSAEEQMVRTLMNLLVDKKRDYREIFTSNETFINRPLAAVYQVPYVSSEQWAPYTFPDDTERAGIISQIGFLSLYSHPGTSSPTLRGIHLHEIFLCEHTPDPPADVDFSSVVDSTAGTVRGRLIDHMENPGCIVCHQRSDPPGLALEHFDGLGQLRKFENGQLIDVSADLFGTRFEGAKGLGDVLYDDPRAPSCLVRNLYSYGVARMPQRDDREYLNAQVAAFAEQGYRVPELFRQLASTPEFFKVVVPQAQQPDSPNVAAAAGN